jgi:hypothetical protein
MHHLMLVTLELPNGGSSEEARRSAYSTLIEDHSFVGESGRFGCPLADWFLIGGRWSGYLREAQLGQPYQHALEQEFPELTKGYFPSSLLEPRKIALVQLWQRFGGAGSNPLLRSGYDEFGDDDDAMLVDQFLYDRFLKPVAGKVTCLDDTSIADFADLDSDEVDESFIGRKWLVIVDYHN